MSVFSLIAKLGINTSEFEAGMDKAQKKAETFGEEMLGKFKGAFAGAFSIVAIEEFIRKTGEAGHQITVMADQYDMTTDMVQRLTKAAERNGLEFTDMASAIDRFSTSVNDALNGGEKMVAMFHDLGFSAEQLKGFIKDPTNGIQDFIRANQQLPDVGERRANLRAVLGRGGGRTAAAFGDISDKVSPTGFGPGQAEAANLMMESWKQSKPWWTRFFAQVRNDLLTQQGWQFEKGKALDDKLAELNAEREEKRHDKQYKYETNKSAFESMEEDFYDAKRENEKDRKADIRRRIKDLRGISLETAHFSAADDLAKIGGFTAGAGRTESLLQDQLVVQRAIKDTIQDLENQLTNTDA